MSNLLRIGDKVEIFDTPNIEDGSLGFVDGFPRGSNSGLVIVRFIDDISRYVHESKTNKWE